MYLSFSYICKYGLFCNLFVPVNKNIAQTLFTYFGWQQCINALSFLSLTCDFALLRNSVTICTKYWLHQFWQHKPDIKEKMLLPRQTNNSDWCILKSFTSFKSGMRYKTKNSIHILVLKIDPSTVNPHAHPEHLLVAVCYYTLQINFFKTVFYLTLLFGTVLKIIVKFDLKNKFRKEIWRSSPHYRFEILMHVYLILFRGNI